MKLRVKIGIGIFALALLVLAMPSTSHARTRTGTDLGTRVARLEEQTARINALLENLSIQGNNLRLASGLNVNGAGAVGPNSAHIVCFENTDGGSEDGVAIKIDRAPCSSDNNFLTFYNDDDYVCGRVEGFSLLDGDPASTFPSLPSIGLDDFFSFCPNFISITGGQLPSFDPGSFPSSLPSLDPGAFPSIDFKSPLTITNPLDAGGDIVSWLADVICWAFENDFQSVIQGDPFGIALAALILVEATLCKNGPFGGVTYGSTGADYAEWLEKLHPSERFLPGQIVGVHGGKISKKTEGAEQVMAISLAPAVIGNVPAKQDEALYERVGFMGQVPVYVQGKVKAGDYIIPSGRGDGIGVAVSPDELDLKDVAHILGRAWSESSSDGVASVNVGIGLDTNELTGVFEKNADRLDRLEEKLQLLRERK